jgi:predicted RNA-binding Zn-ribbon protein involved in translation (DUF1610 family)
MVQRKTAYVRSDNTAKFVCSDCKQTQIIRLEQQLRSSTPVRLRYRCECGSAHVIFLEKRAAVRKKVEIPGQVTFDSRKLPVTIKNLSRTGLLFEPRLPIEVEPGEELSIEFELDHVEKLSFSKHAVVRWSGEIEIGAEFITKDRSDPYDPVYDLALAQYPGK